MRTLILGMEWLDEKTSGLDTEATWKIVLILLTFPLLLVLAFIAGICLRLGETFTTA